MSMRIATVGVGVGALAVVGAVVTGIALRQPPDRDGARVQELPAWFGDVARPNARVAGKVIGAKREMTVHLLLDIPEPTIWKGRQVRTTATGEFDFGAMRAGPYMVFAEGDGAFSRLVHVNTLRGSGDRVELFTYERSTVEHSMRLEYGSFGEPDWDLPYRFVKGDGLAEWERFGVPMFGTVLRRDGSSASEVGVQPVRCPFGDHDVPTGLPTIGTTSASGSFTTFPTGLDVCGVRVWMGAKFHETTIEPRSSTAVVIRLPEAGAEQHGVFDDRSRDFGDPRGAWIRGRVIRGGQGVPDVDVSSFVLPFDTMEVDDTARTRADGSFELYVSSRDLDESHNVMIGANQSIRHLRGRQVVRVSPGETRDGVTIEVGAGVVVSGVVVDEQGDPVPAVRVECEPWGEGAAPTGSDGTFRITIPMQGRCRLHANIGYDKELAPATGLAPKIDVTRPDGDVANIRFVVRRGDVRHPYRHGPGYVDLGVTLQREVVQAVGNELEAAGLRIGDEIVSAMEGERALKNHQLFRAGTAPWGEDIALTVKRGTKTVEVHAKAPTFEPEQR